MSKIPEIILYNQPVRADILLHSRWNIRSIPEFNGTGVEFFDRHVKKDKNDSTNKTNREGTRKEGQLETTMTKEQELQIKIDKYEAVFQVLLRQASELSAVLRRNTLEVQRRVD